MKKNELKQEIANSTNKVKNIHILRELYAIELLLARFSDAKEWDSLTQMEWDKIHIIREIMRCQDSRDIQHIEVFTHARLNPIRRKEVQKA